MPAMEQFQDLEKLFNEAQRSNTTTGRSALGTWVWIYRNRTSVMVHKKEDAYLVMCHDTPFLEVYHNHFILIAPPPESTHYTNSMNKILNAVIPGKKDKKYYSIQRRVDPRLNMRVCKFRGVRFLDHCMVNSSGGVSCTDIGEVKTEVDTDKVLAFRKKLRNYFKPYEVLLRLQSVEDDIKRICDRRSFDNTQELTQRLEISVDDVNRDRAKVFDGINEHIESGRQMNIDLTTLIVLATNPYIHRYYGHDSFLKKVKKTRDLLRLRFTQGCTKVMFDKYIPEEAYVKYKGLVIQSLNGLRSLQVPSQAEVSGQDPGTIPATA